MWHALAVSGAICLLAGQAPPGAGRGLARVGVWATGTLLLAVALTAVRARHAPVSPRQSIAWRAAVVGSPVRGRDRRPRCSQPVPLALPPVRDRGTGLAASPDGPTLVAVYAPADRTGRNFWVPWARLVVLCLALPGGPAGRRVAVNVGLP